MPVLTRTTDVVIVGGGMAGCASAVNLRRAGLSVLLLERLQPGRQSSGINFGGVRQNGRNVAELALARRARAVWGRLPEVIGTAGEFVASGHIYVAPDTAAMEKLEAYHRAAAPYGLVTRLLTASEVRDACPWLGPAVAGGSLCAEDGTANPRLVAAAYAQTARELGVTFVRGEFRGLERSSGGIRMLTDTIKIDAAFAVNAANTSGSSIAASVGDRVAAETVCPNCAVTAPMPIFIRQNVGVIGGDIGLRQGAQGNVVIGGGRTPHDGVDLYPPHCSFDVARKILLEVCHYAPRLAQAKLLRSWSGLECVTADELPVLGWSPRMPNLVHAFGFSEHGFQITPGVGEVVAELITRGETATPIEQLSVARFSGGVAAA